VTFPIALRPAKSGDEHVRLGGHDTFGGGDAGKEFGRMHTRPPSTATPRGSTQIKPVRPKERRFPSGGCAHDDQPTSKKRSSTPAAPPSSQLMPVLHASLPGRVQFVQHRRQLAPFFITRPAIRPLAEQIQLPRPVLHPGKPHAYQ